MHPERMNSDLQQLRDELLTLVRKEIHESMAGLEVRDNERYDAIRDGQVRIQRAVDDMNGKVGRISAEIGYGLPEPEERNGTPTLRARMAALENEEEVVKAIHDSYARTFARWQKVALFAFAAAAAVEGFLRLMGVGG